MKSFFKIVKDNNFISFISQLTFAAIGFANIFLLARSLSKDAFGEWVIYLSGFAFIEMIRSGLTGTPLVKFLSGSHKNDEVAELIGASWILSGIVSLIAIVLTYTSLLLFPGPIHHKGFGLFFTWYPVLAVIVMPVNIAYSILQARLEFVKILGLRLINMGLFFVFLIINFFWFRLKVEWVVVAHLISFGLSAVFTLLSGWSGIKYIRASTRARISEQFNFGRYSLGTLLGSNLLKSSDTFILGIMMTSTDVAYYSIPLKLIEIVEIPIRSLVTVVFPLMSKASKVNRDFEVRRLYYNYTGLATMIFIPFVAALFFLAKPLTLLLGGTEYLGSYTIFWVFLIYALLLPMDRFSGVALDAINRPRLNMIKVFAMASANIIGDVLMIYFFHSLELVAVVTILNVLTGVIIGNWLLKRELHINLVRIFPEGLHTIQGNIRRYLTKGADEGSV